VFLQYVLILGAGISTSCGIPDFRGPKGVWTLEKKGQSPECDIAFEEARPTFTHRFLVHLEKLGMIHYIVSQNVDGLHMRSGFPRSKLAELHGNFFVYKCSLCRKESVLNEASTVLGLKPTGKFCEKKVGGENCGGELHDTILDWEDDLPEHKLRQSEKLCSMSQLSLTIGTSLQIKPAGDLPKKTRKNGGKIVVINLQPTSCDKVADLKIHGYCDEVLKKVATILNITIPEDDGKVKIVERSKHNLPTVAPKAKKRTSNIPKPAPKKTK